MDENRAWWKEAVVYQVYPRSFFDSDGDGIGDIPGISEKLDYIDDLGVDVLWLNPVYDSPNADYGYDIREYRSIMAEFGTMDDWEHLLEAVHDRDMRLIMDLVVNHTSDEHEWFRQSRQEDDHYDDYYYWCEGTPGDPPNNWESFFGGPAWTYDDERGAFYLHLFHEKQPDLNWTNPDVRADIYDIMTWWLEKDIDGFRMDVIDLLSKPEGLPDGDPSRPHVGVEQFTNGPRIHEYLLEMHDEVLSNYDVMTVGEMGGLTVANADAFLGEEGPSLDMAFQFEHVRIDFDDGNRWSVADWSLPDLKQIITRWQTQLGKDTWLALFLNNHDQPRAVSRFGDEQYREASAKLLATFLLTLRGTPYLYQGEEIGMTNPRFESLEQVSDPDTLGAVVSLLTSEDGPDTHQEILDLINTRSRDLARTPMQWSASEHAGFTTGEPWLPVEGTDEQITVAAAERDPESVLHYYRSLIEYRHEMDVLVYGEYQLLCPEDEQVYAYTRALEDDQVLIVLNWSSEDAEIDLSAEVDADISSLMIGTHGSDEDATLRHMALAPYEARVYHLSTT